MREFFWRFYLGFLQLPPHLNRINSRRIILEVIVIFPASPLDNLESHLLRQAIPIIDVGTRVDASYRQIRAYLYAFQGMNPCVIFDGSLAEKPKMLEMMLDIDNGDGPQVPGCTLKRNLQGLS